MFCANALISSLELPAAQQLNLKLAGVRNPTAGQPGRQCKDGHGCQRGPGRWAVPREASLQRGVWLAEFADSGVGTCATHAVQLEAKPPTQPPCTLSPRLGPRSPCRLQL